MKEEIEGAEEIEYQFYIIGQYYILQEIPQSSTLKEILRIYLEIAQAIAMDKLVIPVYNLRATYNSLALTVNSYKTIGIL